MERRSAWNEQCWLEKLKGPEIDAMIYHAVRHDGKDVRYRNSYIDKEKTHLNYVIGPQMGRRFDGTKGRDEAHVCLRYELNENFAEIKWTPRTRFRR